jgi:hypothetical protein
VAKKHPEIKVVSRDRYSNYATAASKALPEAQQVADRWHLIKNLGDGSKESAGAGPGNAEAKSEIVIYAAAFEQESKPALSVKHS